MEGGTIRIVPDVSIRESALDLCAEGFMMMVMYGEALYRIIYHLKLEWKHKFGSKLIINYLVVISYKLIVKSF